MAKAELPESQPPEDATPHPPERRLKPVPALRQYPIHADATFRVWSDAQRGYLRGRTGRLNHAVTYGKDERGIAYGARVLGRRSARSSRGSNDPPGRTGKPSAGPRGTGGWTPRSREVREMQSAERCWVSSHNHWRAGCGESSHVRFGGGPLEKDLLSTTQIPRHAAYPADA